MINKSINIDILRYQRTDQPLIVDKEVKNIAKNKKEV